ncbi:hypothetical protein N3K66_002039 [Trichothecium roseum]|uniref:Uncharacterized protein n=1 Tax=Trichothecium roseum TaxID=47278 RepID=A0ACC0V8G3_9HYPO|nr:hypothetical protein N3K66_002039 [Trichothecium roseum]
MNAGLQHESSRRSSTSSLATRNRSSPHHGRRRSTVLMNLQLNDPSIPSPGEMAGEHHGRLASSPQLFTASPLTADPHHHRAPSLGELHQELEAEQEAHVNRLLQMIRQQQLELQRLQVANPQNAHGESAIADRSLQSTPLPIGSQSSMSAAAVQASSYSRSPSLPHPRGSFEMARHELHRRSRTPSRGASPRLRATSISAESGDWVLGARDESAFYQAETQMLTRENQMLRHRIRDLEKQLTDMSPRSPSLTEPPVASHLSRSSTTLEEGIEPSA